MKGSPVRVRASALKSPGQTGFCLSPGKRLAKACPQCVPERSRTIVLALVTFAAARAARDAATAAKVGVGSRDEVDGKWQAVGVWESRDAFDGVPRRARARRRHGDARRGQH